MIPFMVGPLMAGLVLDNLNPNVLWYAAGILGLVATGVFYLLEHLVGQARWKAIDRRLEIMQALEEGMLTAEAAAKELKAVAEGAWVRLAPQAEATTRRHVHFKVKDLATGDMKLDMSLPAGLVSTVLYMGGQFSPALDVYPHDRLTELLQRSADLDQTHSFDTDQDHLEITVE
jgi:MFS family permease